MAIDYLKTVARLQGHVDAESAEGLQQWLRAGKKRSVDLGRCDSLHTAVLQTLLALAPPIKTPPPHERLRQALGLDPAPQVSERSET